VFFGPEEQYTRTSSSLLSATVQRLLLDNIEATIYSWIVAGDLTNTGIHTHIVAIPYLDVTNISIRQSCLNFAVYSSHMLASFPGLHAQLLSLAVQKAEGRPGLIYHVMRAAADVTFSLLTPGFALSPSIFFP